MAMAKRTDEEIENLKKIFNEKLEEEDFNQEDLDMALDMIKTFRASRLRIESLRR